MHSEMNLTSKLRRRAAELVKGGEPEQLTQAAELLKTLAEIKQQRTNALKLDADRRKTEQEILTSRNSLKDLVVTSTPLLTTAVLAGTLIFQIYQTHQAELEKRAETIRQNQLAEQTRFTEALKLIQASEKISPAATLLNTFTVEPQKSEARQMALKLLLRSQSVDEFQELFSATIDPVSPGDLPTLVQLDRSLRNRFDSFPVTYDPVRHKDDWSKLDSASAKMRGETGYQIEFLSQRISLLLQRPASSDPFFVDPPGTVRSDPILDLSGVALSNADIRGSSLVRANFNNVNFTSMRMDGCDLREITQFANAQFFSTAWWRAAHISQPLLAYLEQTAPFNAGDVYAGAETDTPDDYKRDVGSLKASQ